MLYHLGAMRFTQYMFFIIAFETKFGNQAVDSLLLSWHYWIYSQKHSYFCLPCRMFHCGVGSQITSLIPHFLWKEHFSLPALSSGTGLLYQNCACWWSWYVYQVAYLLLLIVYYLNGSRNRSHFLHFCTVSVFTSYHVKMIADII